MIFLSKTCWNILSHSIRGFVKLKKSKNARKPRNWVGEMCVFSGLFVLYMFQKKKLDMGSGKSEFFADFFIFFQLDKTPK